MLDVNEIYWLIKKAMGAAADQREAAKKILALHEADVARRKAGVKAGMTTARNVAVKKALAGQLNDLVNDFDVHVPKHEEQDKYHEK